MSSAATLPPSPSCGIGLVLEDGPDGVVVRSLNPLGAAALSKADILPNDLLLSVNGSPTATCDAVKARVPGPEGTSVTLALKRSGAPLTVTVVRAPLRSSAPAPAASLKPSPPSSLKALSAQSPPFNPSSSPSHPSAFSLNPSPPSSLKVLSAQSPPFNPSSSPALPSALSLNPSPPPFSTSPLLSASSSTLAPPPSIYIDRSLAAAALKRGPVTTHYTPQFILSLKPPRAQQAAIPWGLTAIEQLECCMRALQPIKTK